MGPLHDLNLHSIDCVIVGCESETKSASDKSGMGSSVWDQLIRANLPFFFKQWGGKNKEK